MLALLVPGVGMGAGTAPPTGEATVRKIAKIKPRGRGKLGARKQGTFTRR